METQALILASLFVALFSVIGFALSNTITKVRELENETAHILKRTQADDGVYIRRLQKGRSDLEIRLKEMLEYASRLEHKLTELDLEIKDKDAQINKLKFDYACEVAGGKRGKKEKPEDEKA